MGIALLHRQAVTKDVKKKLTTYRPLVELADLLHSRGVRKRKTTFLPQWSRTRENSLKDGLYWQDTCMILSNIPLFTSSSWMVRYQVKQLGFGEAANGQGFGNVS